MKGSHWIDLKYLRWSISVTNIFPRMQVLKMSSKNRWSIFSLLLQVFSCKAFCKLSSFDLYIFKSKTHDFKNNILFQPSQANILLQLSAMTKQDLCQRILQNFPKTGRSFILLLQIVPFPTQYQRKFKLTFYDANIAKIFFGSFQ